MKKAQNYGGRKITFELEEVKEIKKFDASGMFRFFHCKNFHIDYFNQQVMLKCGEKWLKEDIINHLHAKFFIGNLKMFL